MNCILKTNGWLAITTFAAILVFGFTYPTANAQERSAAKDAAEPQLSQESIWKAAREGDLAAIKASLESGVEVDAKTEYGATACFLPVTVGMKKSSNSCWKREQIRTSKTRSTKRLR